MFEVRKCLMVVFPSIALRIVLEHPLADTDELLLGVFAILGFCACFASIHDSERLQTRNTLESQQVVHSSRVRHTLPVASN